MRGQHSPNGKRLSYAYISSCRFPAYGAQHKLSLEPLKKRILFRSSRDRLQYFFGDNTMNKDQVKGALKEAEGTIQQGVGKVTGSEKQQAKGLLKQAVGKTQKNYGDAKQDVKDMAKGN